MHDGQTFDECIGVPFGYHCFSFAMAWQVAAASRNNIFFIVGLIFVNIMID